MSNRRGGKGQQQVRLAVRMAGSILLAWSVVTLLFFLGGGEREHQQIANAAYAALQLFFVNVGYESFAVTSEAATPEIFSSWLLVAMRYVVPWMIPILAVLAFVDALRVRLSLWFKQKLGFLCYYERPLVLVVGLGVKGLAIVQAERARSKDTHIVVLERDADNPAIHVAMASGATVWIGDAYSESDIALCCWKRPDRIFAMTGNDQTNLLVLKIARKQLLGVEGDSRLEIFTLIQDIQERRNASSMEMFNEDTDQFWTHLMDYEEDIAAYSLHKYPVLPVGCDAPRVLVVGGGSLGYALTVELLKQGHFMRQNSRLMFPKFVVLDKSADEISHFGSLKKILDYAANKDIAFAELQTEIADINSWTFDDYGALRGMAAFTHIFVTLGSEVRNFTIAGKLAAWESLARGNSIEPKPVVLTYSYEDWVPNHDGAGNHQEKPLPYNVFSLSEVYSSEALQWRDSLREKARRINRSYDLIWEKVSGKQFCEKLSDPVWCEQFELNEEDIKVAGKSWGKTKQRHRDASLDLAKQLAIKENELKRDKVSVKDRALLESLAETEHRRWNAAKLLDGYALNADKKCDNALTHRYLIPFDRLDFDTQCFDYALVYNIAKLSTAVKGE